MTMKAVFCLVAVASAAKVSVTPDVVPWVANGHKSTTAQQFREGIKQLGLTHPKISAHSDAGQYTASGQFMAPLNTPYNPQASKACCTAKCNSADCQHGCDMWLHTSSLNWESTKWWAVLEKWAHNYLYDHSSPQ